MTALQKNPFEGTPYRALRRLGAGGMGEVFEVEHEIVGKLMVAKVLRAELSKDAGTVDRMRVEAQVLARLEHPNIVSVSDFRTTADGRPFFVMELLQGCTVGQELRKAGPFSVEKAIEIMRQVLGALSAAHGLGLVHRDIKLDNVFLHRTPSGERVVKVLDFGVAKVLGGHGGRAPAPPSLPTAEGVIVGTPRYVSPEQVRGKDVDQRADIYGAGLMLYMLITGRGPFDHVNGRDDLFIAHLTDDPEPPSKYSEQAVPHELDAAILRALQKSPDDRFQTAQAFEVALASIASKRSTPMGWLETEPSPTPAAATALPTATIRTGAPVFEDTVQDRPAARRVVPTEVLEDRPPPSAPEVSTRTAPGVPPSPVPVPDPPPAPASGSTPASTYAAGIFAAIATSFVGLWVVQAPSAFAILGVLVASVVAAALAATIAARFAR
ncbi:MAG: serine/threonine protein kinase [Polyangiaceae bacterium]|nr:serine/threonine protein kinase [Polyangiaceae bacterium]MCE7888592.1 serine/threonine protein kinase [Sorangiineae bacterium PRO1]MCL4754130.1 serine/threonine protein kinase [Myxococcales bacterium]